MSTTPSSIGHVLRLNEEDDFGAFASSKLELNSAVELSTCGEFSTGLREGAFPARCWIVEPTHSLMLSSSPRVKE